MAAAKAGGGSVDSSGGELGKGLGDIRRALPVEIVRSQSLCLLERLAHLRPNACLAGERRKVVEKLEETCKRQVQTYNMAHQSQGLSRFGRAFVP